MLGFFPIQKIPYKKIPYKKNVSVFPIQKIYYVVHTQKNCHTFFTMYFFPYKKLLCSAHIQKITSILTHKKLPYKKITSIFSHTKNYYVVHSYKKFTSIFYHTKNLLVFFTIQKITSIFPIQKNYYTKNCYTKKSPYKIITIQNYFILFY